MKHKPWGVTKALGLKGPHVVDAKYGFCDSVKYNIAIENPWGSGYAQDFDRMRIGRIEGGRRYMGNGCWQHADQWEPEKKP